MRKNKFQKIKSIVKNKMKAVLMLVPMWLTFNPIVFAADSVTIDPVKDLVLLLASSVVIIMTVIFAIKEWTKSVVRAALIMVGGSLLFWLTKNPEQALDSLSSVFSKVFGG